MKTKWGTCNQNEQSVWIYLDLAKKSVRCIEYFIVLKVIHFIENGDVTVDDLINTESFDSIQLDYLFIDDWDLLKMLLGFL